MIDDEITSSYSLPQEPITPLMNQELINISITHADETPLTIISN